MASAPRLQTKQWPPVGVGPASPRGWRGAVTSGQGLVSRGTQAGWACPGVGGWWSRLAGGCSAWACRREPLWRVLSRRVLRGHGLISCRDGAWGLQLRELARGGAWHPVPVGFQQQGQLPPQAGAAPIGGKEHGHALGAAAAHRVGVAPERRHGRQGGGESGGEGLSASGLTQGLAHFAPQAVAPGLVGGPGGRPVLVVKGGRCFRWRGG